MEMSQSQQLIPAAGGFLGRLIPGVRASLTLPELRLKIPRVRTQGQPLDIYALPLYPGKLPETVLHSVRVIIPKEIELTGGWRKRDEPFQAAPTIGGTAGPGLYWIQSFIFDAANKLLGKSRAKPMLLRRGST